MSFLKQGTQHVFYKTISGNTYKRSLKHSALVMADELQCDAKQIVKAFEVFHPRITQTLRQEIRGGIANATDND